MVKQLARHIPRKHAMYAHVNAGMKLTVSIQGRKQRVNRAFIYPQRYLTSFQAAKFAQSLADLFPHVEHAFGILQQ